MAGNTTANPHLAAALADLNQSGSPRNGSFDARQAAFIKHFKAVPAEHRKAVCEGAAQALKQRFELGLTPDDIMILMADAIACEHDWDTTITFLKSLLENVSNSDFLQDIALSLLEIADNELTDDKRKLPIGQTALVMITELGLLIANKAGNSSLDYKGMARVVEYITSSLLARSNVNDTAMRISLIHYLSRCPLNNQATSQLNRVMTRFGQSLLDELFCAYFQDKKRGPAAFHFLVQYLNIFLVASPSLSEMSHDVIKHFMLKFPDEFPEFIWNYCDRIPKEEIRLAANTRHLALLLNAAVEVSRRDLAESLSNVLLKNIELFRDISPDALENQVSVALRIIAITSQKSSSATILLRDFVMQANAMASDAQNFSSTKIVSIGRARKAKKTRSSAKSLRFSEEPTPLETILALAS